MRHSAGHLLTAMAVHLRLQDKRQTADTPDRPPERCATRTRVQKMLDGASISQRTPSWTQASVLRALDTALEHDPAPGMPRTIPETVSDISRAAELAHAATASARRLIRTMVERQLWTKTPRAEAADGRSVAWYASRVIEAAQRATDQTRDLTDDLHPRVLANAGLECRDRIEAWIRANPDGWGRTGDHRDLTVESRLRAVGIAAEALRAENTGKNAGKDPGTQTITTVPADRDPLERPEGEKTAWRRAELPTEWTTLALYDDASGLEDEDEADARSTLHSLFEDDGYRVITVRDGKGGEPPSEPLDGKWRGLYAEGCTAEYMAQNDTVAADDESRGLWTHEPVDGAEYLLRPERQDLVWLPTVWTSVILEDRWDENLWHHWSRETGAAFGPEAYDRWRETMGKPPVRPVGRYGHERDGRWNRVGDIRLTLWLADTMPPNPGHTPRLPKRAPRLPEAIATRLEDE